MIQGGGQSMMNPLHTPIGKSLIGALLSEPAKSQLQPIPQIFYF
jgi:hypothetical protein